MMKTMTEMKGRRVYMKNGRLLNNINNLNRQIYPKEVIRHKRKFLVPDKE